MKLSERLRDLSAAQEPCDPHTHDFGKKAAFEEAAQLAKAYEAEVEKRVAELELDVALMKDNLELSRKVIDNLKSQLAWTPVSAGLPMEPGYYLFTNDEHSVMFYRRGTHPKWTWESVSGAKFQDERMRGAWDSFRRIELPEAPPPFAKETSPDSVRELHVAQGCVVPPTTTLTDEAQDADLPSVTVSITPRNTLNVDLNALEWCSLEESGALLRELVRNLDHLIRQPVCPDEYVALVPTWVTTATQLHVKAVSVMNSEMSKGRLFKEGGKWRFFS